jgi:hypothetical protein
MSKIVFLKVFLMVLAPARGRLPSPTDFTCQISDLTGHYIEPLLNIKTVVDKIIEFTIIIIIIIHEFLHTEREIVKCHFTIGARSVTFLLCSHHYSDMKVEAF